MIKFDAWMLPDGETHLSGWMTQVNRRVDGRLAYQYHKYEAALALCGQRQTAIDIGAHVGLLSYWMARDFKNVGAFEPVAAHRECFAVNVRSPNVILHACALGECDDMVSIKTAHTSSGDSVVNGAGDIPMHRLDDFTWTRVSFIKIDCEGAEEKIIRGGLETIKFFKPVMLVEQKGGEVSHFGLKKDGAIRLLESIGMKSLRPPMSGDWIMGW